ncbi:MAG: hypothetical protein U1F77_03860 [Kiritimatiellia bacterium]
MFFEGERIYAIRGFIVAETKAEREVALDKLLPLQRGDFEGIFQERFGLPATIRLLDPPLHEFVPYTPEAQQETAKPSACRSKRSRSAPSSSTKPTRCWATAGCRLSVTYPELAVMQTWPSSRPPATSRRRRSSRSPPRSWFRSSAARPS